MPDMPSPIGFLRSVAEYYGTPDDKRPKLGRITFVLPNKRSVLFLKKYIQDGMKKVSLMPRIMTDSTFISIVAGAPEARRTELLFILYDAYCHVMQNRGRKNGMREFDNFIFWGDMMLDDFDDIDKSMVNAKEVFCNLRNLKEIQADYLDEEQKEVVRRIWGESRLTAHIDDFWLHFGDGTEGEMRTKFVYLWEILGDIYTEFYKRLSERGICSKGAQYRRAVEAVRQDDYRDFTGDTHYVFVGFNNISVAGTLIFERFKRKGVASFFWDTAPLELAGENGVRESRALSRLARLSKNFPMPEDYSIPPLGESPEITVTSVPSNAGQAKAAGSLLKEWSDQGFIDPSNPLNTAVILPDQGLLVPMLMAIPADIEALNISMGISYRTTTFATLLHSIISMQLRARVLHGVIHFYHEDITEILNHPHIRLIAYDEADELSRKIMQGKLYNVPETAINVLKEIFTPVKDLNNVKLVYQYLSTLFDWLGEKLEEHRKSTRTASFETEAIKFFRSEVEELTTLIEEHNVQMSERTFLHMFERAFSARALSLSGTPLKGLQILGVLETRTLDFENVIVLSLNERIFPKKQYTKTMIPNTLRAGYGLPDFESSEWTYAYSFYRLLSRAKRVALFYDSRAESLGGGEISRYITQMRYLMPSLTAKFNTLNLNSVPSKQREIRIKKTPEICKLLEEFYPGGSLRLSASALKTFRNCPLQFYLSYVHRMRTQNELVDYLTAADYGTVVHNVIQTIYDKYKNQLIDEQLINSWLSHPTLIGNTVYNTLVKVRYPHIDPNAGNNISAEGRLACEVIEMMVRSNLQAEADCYCAAGKDFTFLENEMEINAPWKIDDELTVNFYMSIDRVDKIAGNHFRFIDFKTGKEDSTCEKIESMFSGHSTKDAILQLLIYCETFLAIKGDHYTIAPVVHPMRSLASSMPIKTMNVAGEELTDYKKVRNRFQPELHNFVKRIFNPEEDFYQCESVDDCGFCAFTSMCGRIKKEY
ncbi:MAG: PD-(D/E)XK nuclease family protein [Muribaculaceae bacterium]|nr:PD-(D/E)XK nuclease family protein [Muribaculaceae bacterium]